MSEVSLFRALIGQTNLYIDTTGERLRVGIPVNANIAADTVGLYAKGEKANHVALIHEHLDGTTDSYTFAELDQLACQLANYLTSIGVSRGQPVAIHTGQSPQTGIAHLAIYKVGAVAMTLSHLYGPETVKHVLEDSKTEVIITNSDFWSKLRGRLKSHKYLKFKVVYGKPVGDEIDFERCIVSQKDTFEPVITATEEPALLMYSSGSTGLPKGIIHSHRVIHAYLPSLTMVYNLELNYTNGVFWSPADWAWVGGLLDLVFPAWQHGQTVISTNRRLSATWAFEFMERHQVTHSFMTPTALKRLAEIRHPRKKWNLAMRVICTGGESLASEVLRWANEELGIVCNEFYGLTEFTDLVGCCEALFPTIPGSMGIACPGRTVSIIEESGKELPSGTIGEIASWLPQDPSLFMGYWGKLGIPENIKIGNWLRSGDLAMKDDNGYFWYHGRNDDLIKSAGYRIGPNEIENSMMSHPDVAEVAVVSKPDQERAYIVVAFVRLKEGVDKSERTKVLLQQHVKNNLAVYKYPREIEFLDSFPLTSSGKIRRNVLRAMVAATSK